MNNIVASEAHHHVSQQQQSVNAVLCDEEERVAFASFLCWRLRCRKAGVLSRLHSFILTFLFELVRAPTTRQNTPRSAVMFVDCAQGKQTERIRVVVVVVASSSFYLVPFLSVSCRTIATTLVYWLIRESDAGQWTIHQRRGCRKIDSSSSSSRAASFE